MHTGLRRRGAAPDSQTEVAVGRRSTPPITRRQMLLALQRSAGNAATTQLLGAMVQRDDGSSTSSEEESSSSDVVEDSQQHVRERASQSADENTPPGRVSPRDDQAAEILIADEARRKGDPGKAATTRQRWRELSADWDDLLDAASGESSEESDDSMEEQQSGEDPVSFVDRHRRGDTNDDDSESSQSGRLAKPASDEESEGVAVDAAMLTGVSSRSLLNESRRLGARVTPPTFDDPDAATAHLEKKQGLLSAVIDQADTIFGPGPEATPSSLGGGPGAVLGPITSTDPGGLGVEGPTSDVAAGAGSYTATQDFLGNLARIATGIRTFVGGWRGHKGKRRLTSKDSRHGLGEIARGTGGASLSMFSIVKQFMDAAGQAVGTVVDAVAGAAGAVMGTITAVLTTRKAWRAQRRRQAGQASQMEASNSGGQLTKRSQDRAERQDWRFWNRLRAAAQLLKRKSSRKEVRKGIGAAGAGLSALGGVALFIGLFAAANIWNPIGWALGGVALAGAIGLGVYRLWRRIKRAKHRRRDLRQVEAPSFFTGKHRDTRMVPGQAGDYAAFVVTELNCRRQRGHEHATEDTYQDPDGDGHEQIMEDFVTEVLRKKPDKVRERGPKYIAGKWSTW